MSIKFQYDTLMTPKLIEEQKLEQRGKPRMHYICITGNPHHCFPRRNTCYRSMTKRQIIFICFDNQAAIKVLVSYHTNSKLVCNCVQCLIDLATQNNLTYSNPTSPLFRWTRASEFQNSWFVVSYKNGGWNNSIRTGEEPNITVNFWWKKHLNYCKKKSTGVQSNDWRYCTSTQC